ncbi:putative Ras association domain-containing protein 1 [Hypsibius exemplaris]|uniref:Ras association domain-containing protein 1 n=1 Tax=Hypsibius exemplaris TaxID=2072580 RepID=A0A1W0X4K2_HYPEX|nr:putative Ras association domain-containing protein 1 [Hypsibius exemplaris]
MMREMGMKLQDAIQGPFRKKKSSQSPPAAAKNVAAPPDGPTTTKVPAAKVSREREVENLQTNVQIRYLSSRQLEEAAQAERYLLENMDNGADFKNLFYLKHQFLILELEQPSFCDLCGLLIWGVYRLSLRCRNCNLTCHPQCKQFLRLVCPKPRPEKSSVSGATAAVAVLSDVESNAETTPEADVFLDDCNPWTLQSPPMPDNFDRSLSERIDEFNKSFPFALLQLEPDGSYTGFVRILLRLKRPITVANGPFPLARVTSFYLPRNAEKLIHVGSLNNTAQVIDAILTKFRVRDDPRKFSLHLEERDGAKRLDTVEFPLQLVLAAREHSTDCCRLILEEQDPRNVLWDAFTLPELENFKLILDREEEDMVKVCQQNYDLYHRKLMEALDTTSDGKN